MREYRLKWKKVVRGESRVEADSPQDATRALLEKDEGHSFASSLTADDYETVVEDGLEVEAVLDT